MSAPDIHPENLLERFAAGGLSQNEHELVQEHLAGCAACRFELLVRADLETEADAFEFDRISTRQLLLALPTAQSANSPAAELSPAPHGVVHDAPAVRRRRPWRRVVAITAAALGLASGAAALVATQVPSVSRTLDVTARASTPTAKATTPGTHGQQHVRRPPAAVEAAPQVVPLHTLPLGEAAPPQAPERTPSPASRPDAPRKNNDDALSAAQLFSDANQARRASNPGRATELYRLLQRKFPRSQEAQLSLVTLGSLQLNGGNAGGALATFNRYLSHGGRSLEAEALYGKAQALRRLGRASEERSVWERLLARYPGSGYAPQARERLDSLGGS